MSALIESYNKVSKYVKELNFRIKSAEEEIEKLSAAADGDVSVRIARLKEQLEKIDEYALKLKGFQDLAAKNLDSQNVQTIEAPPGYRVNMNRIRNWAMMIDPSSSNDPYAQRVYVVAKCDEFFLEKKRKEFNARVRELEEELANGVNAEIAKLTRVVRSCKAELKKYALGPEVAEFAGNVLKENTALWLKSSPAAFKDAKTAAETVALGAYSAPFLFDEEQRSLLKAQMRDFYDDGNGRVLLPAELSNKNSYILTVTCSPSRRRELDEALQHLVLSTVENSPSGERKVYVLDAIRYNSASMGTLRKLESTFAMEEIPRGPEKLTETLVQIASSCADADELVDMRDSVAEYNECVDSAGRIPLTTVIVFGWPKAFTGRNKELLEKILTNYERYGVSFVFVAYSDAEKKNDEENSPLPEYALQNSMHISMLKGMTTVSRAGGAPNTFVWYRFQDKLSGDYVKSVKAKKVDAAAKGNVYINRYPLNGMPAYKRGNKNVLLPYGVDSKDEVHSMDFNNENFASFIMGASGSGKSTLLHVLITSILKEYHPDDVELWLADFKMAEFSQYIDPLPPHVKYILLDESPELVYDLIDRLTEKMMERQRFFMKNRKLEKKVEKVPANVYMPIIFVILDEFSIMSQAVSESEIYKLKLQNLLAKGRALGIKFIFSSQTFTKGVSGLTSTAKDQIQARIAMKNSTEEISETLSLSASSKTEQVRNWMDALPVHYTLAKFLENEEVKVKRFKVMYFEGKGNDAYKPQRELIRSINHNLRPIPEQEYDSAVPNTYVDKKPVIVDGNSYKVFDTGRKSELTKYREKNAEEISESDVVINFGSPRRMVEAKYVVLSSESRENLLLIAGPAERSCAMSLVKTAMDCFELQHGRVQIWAYSKNRLYRAYKDSHFSGYEIHEGMSEICAAIKDIRGKIIRKEAGNDLIILLGMEQICTDFGLIDFSAASNGTSTLKVPSDYQKLVATTEEELKLANEVKDLQKAFSEQYNINKMEEQWLDEGKSIEEISEEETRLYDEFLKKNNVYGTATQDGDSQADTAVAEPKPQEPEEADGEIVEETADESYNASEDFKYIVKQGSRFGYHFMLCLSDLFDLKAASLQLELFRHKLAFQVSPDDSITLFASKVASKLREHVCQYSNSLEKYSLRPFLHEGIVWGGWDVDADGNAVSPE